MLDPVEMIGWAGSAFTLTAYAMKTMLPLRLAAIASGLFFIAYTSLLGLWPLLALELVLLPFNLWRVGQILQLRRKVTAARRADPPDFSLIKAYSRAQAMVPGERIFSRGDRPDRLYYIASGEVLLDELGIRLGAGEIFGEISFFTDAKERSASASCSQAGRIHSVDEATFLRLYFQDPSFGLAVLKLITRRLSDGRLQSLPSIRPVLAPDAAPA
ncbi:Crp/Fnr family transcriptional regulator [Tropicimonas sp. IMCC34043]|uniref:Crp/Fnr family transcriptional regulator n=1 Tax=Tropicimonas sp. IMCC34043 TaxID=2248760 RepID=UPI000E24D5F1|nr:cyclic nucleotide-binding domain-containing protein [Tropicimonas sp. IMCC34043]